MAEAARIDALFSCLSAQRQGQSIMFASAALLLFDYLLTLHDEIRYVWRRARVMPLGTVAFLMVRYSAIACVALELVTSTSNISNNVMLEKIVTVLKLICIIASEFILTVRTWAIWQRSRVILIGLVVLASLAIAVASAIVARDVMTSEERPPLFNGMECKIIDNAVKGLYIVPFVEVLVYEFIVMCLSVIRLVRWRNAIPEEMHSVPLLNILWRDGILYFSWMLVLGFLNIGLVAQAASQQPRLASALLQAVIHSMLSTRMILHLSSLSRKDGSSDALTTHIRFTTLDPSVNASDFDWYTVNCDDDEYEPDRRHKLRPSSLSA